jgi:hypothetical protein
MEELARQGEEISREIVLHHLQTEEQNRIAKEKSRRESHKAALIRMMEITIEWLKTENSQADSAEVNSGNSADLSVFGSICPLFSC